MTKVKKTGPIEPILRFEIIPLKDIIPDQNQPRKFFNEADMEELTASIKQTGVIQPILVRPSGKKYMLVSGERRYRASKEAGLKDIPAVIKELTDDQALEIQIVENLQRKDVHPLEEAEAYKTLAMSKTMKEIAKQVGKTEAFVTKRMQLCNLIEEAKKAFYEGKCTIETAIKIASLDNAYQSEIMVSSAGWDGIDHYVKKILDKSSFILSSAKFPIDQPGYLEKVPSCLICPANSANKPMLFDDGIPHMCTKPTCFMAKTDEFERSVYEIHTVVDTSYSKEKQKRAIAAGLPVCTSFDRVHMSYADGDEMTIEEYIEEKYYCSSEEDSLEAMIKALIDDNDIESEEELRKEYAEYKADREREIQELDQRVQRGEVVKAYNLADNNFVYITKCENSENEGNKGKANESAELVKIINKEQRAQVLDKIKLYELLQKYVMQKDDNLDNKLPGDKCVSLYEWATIQSLSWKSIDFSIIVAYMANELRYKDDFNTLLKKKIKNHRLKGDHRSVEDLYSIIQDEDIQMFIFKYFTYHVAFPTYNEIQAETNILSYTSMEFAKENFNQSCHDFSTIINEKAQKRIERYDAKIAQLKAAGNEEEE
jgi:ParB/RepB/Spo0J family partition protein